MLLHMNPETPPERQLQQAVDLLEKGGLLIYPTDTVYALGCDIANKAAVERVCQLKGVDCKKHRFACIVPDMKTLGQYTVQVDTATFKLVNRLLPGPYTLILNASNQIPRHFLNKRREVGLRWFAGWAARYSPPAFGTKTKSWSIARTLS